MTHRLASIGNDHRSSFPLQQRDDISPIGWERPFKSNEKAFDPLNFSIGIAGFFIKGRVDVTMTRSAVSDDRQMSNLLRSKTMVGGSRLVPRVPLFFSFSFLSLFFFSFILPRRPSIESVSAATSDLYLRSRNSFSGLGASSCHVSHGSGAAQRKLHTYAHARNSPP